MSKTTDFIENNISQLQLDIMSLQSDKDMYLKKIEFCNNEISNKQFLIDDFNKENEKIKK